MDKVLDQLLLGQSSLLGDARLVLRQLRLDIAVSLGHVASGVFVIVVAKLVGEAVALLGLAQSGATAVLSSPIVTLVAGGVGQYRLQGLALATTLVLLVDFVA